MSKNAKTSLLLVFCLLLPLLIPNSAASSVYDEVQIVSFDQEDGLHVQSMLNISGDSTVALSSIEIELWNISSPDQWTAMLSSPFLDSVVPYSLPESGMTMWSWNHSFNLSNIDCTCYVEISLLEQTDLTSFGLVVYAGQDNHRPVLRPSSSNEADCHDPPSLPLDSGRCQCGLACGKRVPGHRERSCHALAGCPLQFRRGYGRP